jgi:hypothetical protein
LGNVLIHALTAAIPAVSTALVASGGICARGSSAFASLARFAIAFETALCAVSPPAMRYGYSSKLVVGRFTAVLYAFVSATVYVPT